MLEEPAIPVTEVITSLRKRYDLEIARLRFLPLGADANSASYRAETLDGSVYFLKLRRGAFDEIAVEVPYSLSRQGIRGIIAPLKSREGNLCAELGEYRMIVYPFVDGEDAYETSFGERGWVALGRTLKQVHAAKLPPGLAGRLRVEHFSLECREHVRGYQRLVAEQDFTEPVAAKLAAFILLHQETIEQMLRRAEALAEELAGRRMPHGVCHGDLHPGNLHITPGGDVFLVDWDDVLLAPVERDLMFLSAGMGGAGAPGEREVGWFLLGYGDVELDAQALAYYRCERILRDIAEFSRQILESEDSREDREQSYRYFTGQFAAGGVVAAAMREDAGL